MKIVRCLFVLLFVCRAVSASAAVDCKGTDHRLHQLTVADQQVREEWAQQQKHPTASGAEKEELQQRWYAIDGENLVEFKEIVAACGWPVSKAGSSDAWLLAQHADRDHEFQHHAKDLIAIAVKNGTASPQNLAYLADRLAVAEGRPQEYGTQFTQTDRCHLEILPVDSIELVNRRRLAIGLQSVEAYEAEGRRNFIPADCAKAAG